MREIKFRAWSNYSNDMVSWSDMVNDTSSMGVINGEDIKIEVMQYTGLKDKNGVDIYEGDVVRVRNGATSFESYFIGLVIFEGGKFGYKASRYEGYRPPYMFKIEDVLYFGKSYSVEIIGNIYENPKLLKQGEFK